MMMMLSEILFFCAMFLSFKIRGETIQLPTFLLNNNFSASSAIYLCHLYQLNNSKNVYLQGYDILDGKERNQIHHLLIYECSNSENNASYSGLCGMDNVRLMPKSIYHHCQTQIIVAWAKGGQLKYDYPIGTGLKMTENTRLLLEVHFDRSVPRHQSIGLHLRFYPVEQPPSHEIGVLTLGTLARSPLFLPPRLDTIRFPTYCFNDCLKYFLRQTISINIFSILLHAHRRATRITLDQTDTFTGRINRLIDRNPFEFHRQKTFNFKSFSFPQITRSNELILTCHYSTRNDYLKPIVGGYDSNNEMCQAFLYYYPKISSFPLCLSLPIYTNLQLKNENWTEILSMFVKRQLESNTNYLGMCGDNLGSDSKNQTMLRSQRYQRPIGPFISIHTHFQSFFYIFLVLLLLISVVSCCHYQWKTYMFFF